MKTDGTLKSLWMSPERLIYHSVDQVNFGSIQNLTKHFGHK